MKLNDEYKKAIIRDVVKWNTEHPLDYYYRKRFNIALFSEAHLATSFIEQEMWSEEEKFQERMREYFSKEGSEKTVSLNEYGQIVSKEGVIKGEEEPMTEDEVNKAFEIPLDAWETLTKDTDG